MSETQYEMHAPATGDHHQTNTEVEAQGGTKSPRARAGNLCPQQRANNI